MEHRDPRTYALNPFGRLVAAQAASMVGDACLTVSLAGSIFFTQPLGQSRTQVLLYLLLTIAPFAVVGPIIGPALDRSRAGRRTLMAIGCFGRAAVCFLMVGNLDSLFLFPLAFVALVLSKGHAVAKSALLPAVVNDEHALVEANSRLSLVSVVASVVGGLPAAACVALFDARVSLIFGTIVFGLAGVLCTKIPAAGRPASVETEEERQELAAPSIVFAGTAMAVMRGCVGFLTFQLAFILKGTGQPAWFFGVVLAASAVGGFLGVIVTPVLRRRLKEETILAGALVVPAIVALFAARDGGRVGSIAIAFTIAIGAACGRIAFDSLLQRDGPEHLRGRAFARFETRFQLSWCAGALIPVALLDVLTRRSGFFLLALVLGFAGLSYVGGLRARHQWGPHELGHPPADPDAPQAPQPEPEPERRPPPRPARARSRESAASVNRPVLAGAAATTVGVDLEMRPIVPDELPSYKRTDEYGFGFRRDAAEAGDQGWTEIELERTVAVFEGDEIVGTGRNYSLELTLPGGAIIPASAVSWIAVRPTHRRRGILRRMMTYLVEEGAQRGEPASILTASEGGIYGRFGFGVASRTLSIEIQSTASEFAAPVTAGRVRMIEPEESLKVAPELFDRMRARRNGAVSRPPSWWTGEWAPSEWVKARFDVVYELDGRVEGYAVYSVDGTWSNGFSDKTVSVRDLVAATPDAEAALWQYLCSIDLTKRVTAWNVDPDIELPFRLRDMRQMRTTSWRDWLWLRPVDVPALLGARRYATADRLVIDVRDEMRPEGSAAGRFVIEGGPDGATCGRTDASPDLVLEVSALGAISLGGHRASMLARAGTIEEQAPGALAVADRMFAADREPFAFTWF